MTSASRPSTGTDSPSTPHSDHEAAEGILAQASLRPKTVPDDDPYLWLEEVEGDDALAWVRKRNDERAAELTEGDQYTSRQTRIRTILDSDDRIPYVTARGDHLYNFWRDSAHPQGLWRRTTWESYRGAGSQADIEWETLLDLDALSEAEDQRWVWHGAHALPERSEPGGRPTYHRVLIDLSPGGSDSDITREFDLDSLEFVEGGFHRPQSKGGMAWIDRDSVFIYTDFGEGTLTTSGYPRIAKRLRRGQELEAASTVYEGTAGDMYIAAGHDHTPGFERSFVSRTIDFYTSELYLVGAGDTLTLIDVPRSANAGLQRDWLVLRLRDDWNVTSPATESEHNYGAGSLLTIDFPRFLAGFRDFTVLFEPTASTSLAASTWTKDYLVLNVLEDVKNRLVFWRPDSTTGTWEQVDRDLAAIPELASIHVAAVDSDESNDVWVQIDGFLNPPSLALADIDTGESEAIRSTPEFFNTDGLQVSQGFTTSADGTPIPYFLVAGENAPTDGTSPTLLYAYGGFEISLTPFYAPTLGAAWLEAGGTYVLANIRGGGEYGPAWHQAALKQNRNRCYEDLAAVARDLFDRGITTPAHLGVQGGSNGGLMAGNMYTQYPELFAAVVIQVPLLDMKRYSHLLAGASWIAEYGDPDTDEWEFIQTFSPYHLYRNDAEYPPVLITTSTKDDRVHPGHARKFAARLLADDRDVTYYENIEGGHGGAANNEQAAHMQALAYAFLATRLGLDTPGNAH